MRRTSVTALILRLGTPAFRGSAHMLRQNPHGMPVRIIGSDSDEDVPERFGVDRFYALPQCTDPSFADLALEICKKEGVDVVLSHHELEALALSSCEEKFAELGIRLLLSPHAAVRLACDKAELLALFHRLGLPYPDYAVLDDPKALREAAVGLGYPERKLAIKPALSWGGRGFHVLSEEPIDPARFFSERAQSLALSLRDLEAVLERSERVPRLLLTEYLPGEEYSVDAFRGESLSIAIPRIRKRVFGGVAAETELEYREDLMEYTLKAADALGLRYLFGMQFCLDKEGVPRILECNPRIQGTAIASLFSGVNLLWLAVCEALAEPLPPLPETRRRARYSRSWSGIASGADWHETV